MAEYVSREVAIEKIYANNDLSNQLVRVRDELAYQQLQIMQSIASGLHRLQSVYNEPYPAIRFEYQPKYCCAHEGTRRTRPTNCPNCGAPVQSGQCEYCGTRFD